jgi:uncharacterized protein YoxC
MATKKKDEQIEETDDVFETETLTEDSNGNAYLPEMEKTVTRIKELANAIKDVKQNLSPVFVEATTNLKAGQKLVQELAHKHKEHFVFDADDRTYTYDDGDVRLVIKEEEKLTYEVLDDE